MRLRHMVLMILAGMPLCVPLAHADQVGDDITRAADAWRAHDARAALNALQDAAGLLRQARADALKALLPLPPPDWTADPAETTVVSGEELGGGTSAIETYHDGAQQVQVQFTADSPMLQGMAALISSPLANSAGVRTDTIGGQAISYTARDNGFMTLVGGKIVVKVNGNKATPEPVLRSFVATIDFAALEKLTH
jgi:hypothetical protein